jgi:hypothetical protein
MLLGEEISKSVKSGLFGPSAEELQQLNQKYGYNNFIDRKGKLLRFTIDVSSKLTSLAS